MPQLLGGLGDRWGADLSPAGVEGAYANAADAAAPGIVDYARTIQIAGENIVSAISRARLTVNMSAAQQSALQDVITRAQQGLPPPGPNVAPAVPTWVWVLGAVGLVLLVTSRGGNRA